MGNIKYLFPDSSVLSVGDSAFTYSALRYVLFKQSQSDRRLSVCHHDLGHKGFG